MSGHHRLRRLRRPMSTRYHRDRPAPITNASHPRRPPATAVLPVGRAPALSTTPSPSGCWHALPRSRSRSRSTAADEVTARRARAPAAPPSWPCERARYEAEQAERAFTPVDPENRLVARTLEARWEPKLAALAEAEAALAATRDARPPLPDRDDLQALAADLPGSGTRHHQCRGTANGCCAP